jgi:hypothetical protein
MRQYPKIHCQEFCGEGAGRRRAEQQRRHNGNIAGAILQVPEEVTPVASRLYRTTRPLYLTVTRILDQLGAATVGSPTTVVLIALYVTGLVLLDARPTQTRVTRFLPGRCTTRSTGCCGPHRGRRGRCCAGWPRRSSGRAQRATCAWTTWW